MRISAVLTLEVKREETYPGFSFDTTNKMWLTPQPLLMHNPWAYYGLPARPWEGIAQFIQKDGHIEWTDGVAATE